MRKLSIVLTVILAALLVPGIAFAQYGGLVSGQGFVEGTASVTSTSSTSLIGVPGSGLYIYVSHFSCFNSGGTGTTVSLQNGSGGTTIWEGYAAASGGGFVVDFPTPIGGNTNMTVNTALYFAAGSNTTTLYCSAAGYKGS